MQIKPEKKCAYLFLFRVKASFALVNAKAYLQGEKKKTKNQGVARQMLHSQLIHNAVHNWV